MQITLILCNHYINNVTFCFSKSMDCTDLSLTGLIAWVIMWGKQGVRAMHEKILLKGRPRGGAAIIWKGSLKARVTPIDIESQRVCVVSIEYDYISIRLIYVYMPRITIDPIRILLSIKVS